MKYLKGFIRFWRNFIIGDNEVIALAILWGLTFLYIMCHHWLGHWAILPAIVCLVLLIEPFAHMPLDYPYQRYILFFALQSLALNVPVAIFRIAADDITYVNIMLILISLIPIAISSYFFAYTSKKYPIATHIAAVAVTVSLFLYFHL